MRNPLTEDQVDAYAKRLNAMLLKRPESSYIDLGIKILQEEEEMLEDEAYYYVGPILDRAVILKNPGKAIPDAHKAALDQYRSS